MAYADELASQIGATIASPRTASSYLRMIGGANLYNSFGGGASQTRIASYETITNACTGHNQYFPTNYASNVQFLTINVLDGHTATNTAVDVRHCFGQVLRSNGTWEFAYHSAPMYGKRLPNGNLGNVVVPGTQTQLPGGILRCQPGPAKMFPNESNAGIWGYEMWPSDWDGSGNAVSFYGKVDKSLYQSALCFVVGVQLRLSLWDEAGVDDRSSAFVVAQTGFDGYASPRPSGRYISDSGVIAPNDWPALGYYPYAAMDGSFGPWVRITGTDWQWVYCVTVTELCAVESSLPPGWGNYTTPWTWATPGDESITEAQFYANPPPRPPGTVEPEEPPPPSERLPLPSTGRWFAKLTSGDNTWASKTFSTTPASKLRTRRRGAKLWS